MENTKLPVIATLTTSPTRIHKMYKTLKSIQGQTRAPDRIIVNLPYVFQRTGETYQVPRFFEEFPNLYVNWVDVDYGPATKLIPTLALVNTEAYLWVVDDDQDYLSRELAFLLSCAEDNKVDTAYCLSGLKMTKNGGIKEAKDRGSVDIFEAYSGVLLKRSMFEDDFYHYMGMCIAEQNCRISDDLIISLYLQAKGYPIEKVGSIMVNQWLHWKLGGVLDYGDGSDALHNAGDGLTIKRYKTAYPIAMQILYSTVRK